MKGVVKKYTVGERGGGDGWITDKIGDDYHVSWMDIAETDTGFYKLCRGDCVEFTPCRDEKGLFAKEVVMADKQDPECRRIYERLENEYWNR